MPAQNASRNTENASQNELYNCRSRGYNIYTLGLSKSSSPRETTVNTEERVKDVIAQQLGAEFDDIRRQTTMQDLGADSLDIVEVVMEIEEEFDITIPTTLLRTWKTLGRSSITWKVKSAEFLKGLVNENHFWRPDWSRFRRFGRSR